MDQNRHAPAPVGSLSKAAVIEARAVDRYCDARERALHALLGRRLRPSLLRDQLMMLTVIAFAEGELRRIAFYERECRRAGLGGSWKVWEALAVLMDSGVVTLAPDPTGRRGKVVIPTQRLIQFCNDNLPLLLTAAVAVLQDLQSG